MSRILGSGITMLGLAAMVAAPAFARGGGNFGRAQAWSHPTVHDAANDTSSQPTARVDDHPGHAGPVPVDGSPQGKQ
jgi:hypothetical protein